MSSLLSFHTQDQLDWFASEIEAWTTEIEVMLPSEWAEKNRYLPPSVTSMAGYFSFGVTPYLKEPLDSLAIDSQIKEVYIRKGVQIAYTTGILENYIGYTIDYIKTAPTMMVTADAELAKLRMDSNVTPLIQNSDLEDRIMSEDELNSRKTGKTDKKISWEGGGFLIPFGAQNANKLRSMSIRILLCDENDGWPLTVGKDGDPFALVKDRTAAYEQSRKILGGSTPTVRGTSAIDKLYERGDKRKYHVNCLGCGHSQEIRWRVENHETGEVTGITWDVDDMGRLVTGSTRWLCAECGHAHTNDDKIRLLDPESGAKWVPTATPAAPHIRSYHMPALISPVGMQSWDECVMKWLEAWDVVKNKMRDEEKLQVFYNNVLGVSYELQGQKLKMQNVSPHRRREYKRGEVCNKFALAAMGGPVLALVCTVDVQQDWLAVAVFGFTRGGRFMLVDYEKWDGDTSRKENEVWQRLSKLIETKRYTADDGKEYGIALSGIDSGYRTETVYDFCGQYESGVIAIKGREGMAKGSHMKHFATMEGTHGVMGYTVTVDIYKDRIHAALRHEWDKQGIQPERQWNAPDDILDSELKELTVETKREKINKQTGKREGFYWHRPGGSRNELFDLTGYAYFLHDALAHNMFPPNEKNGEFLVNWQEFYDTLSQGVFWT